MSCVTVRGTHKGEFVGIPPSGRQVTVELIDVSCISGGKVGNAGASSTSWV